MRLDLAFLAARQSEQVRWIPPPRGTLRHGIFWVTHPRVFVVVVLAMVVAILALAIYRRTRR